MSYLALSYRIFYRQRIILLVAILLGILSCEDDDPYSCADNHSGEYQAQFEAAAGHKKYQVIESFFSSIEMDSAYVIHIDSMDINRLIFKADNKSTLCIPNFFIKHYSLDLSNFRISVHLNNRQIVYAPLFNKIKKLVSDSIQVDPYQVNPLCARLSIESPLSLSASITVIGKRGEYSNISHHFPKQSKQHIIPVLGLYGDYENQVILQLNSKHGSTFYIDTITVTTQPLDVFTSDIAIISYQPTKMKRGLNLVSARNHPGYDLPFMFDMYGEIRWLLDFKNHPDLNRLYYDTGIEKLKNGNWYFGDAFTDKIYEVGLLGNIINQWELGEFSFHHKVEEKNNGNFLVTVSQPGSRHLNGRISKDDHIIELDRISGDILHVLDLKESLDEYRTSIANTLNNNRVDWLHANALYSEKNDQSIIFSSRYQGVIKVTLQNEIKWILGPHRGWTVDRSGLDLSPYLLTPLNAQGQPITDANVIDGAVNHPDFEWNWGQHAVSRMANGHLILYDNGYNRNFDLDVLYSRIVEYEIDEINMTVRQIWSFGKENGAALSSSVGSNVDYDEETDNYFMNGGFVVPTSSGYGGKMLEIDRATREIVFEAELTADNAFVFHRMHRINLYD